MASSVIKDDITSCPFPSLTNARVSAWILQLTMTPLALSLRFNKLECFASHRCLNLPREMGIVGGADFGFLFCCCVVAVVSSDSRDRFDGSSCCCSMTGAGEEKEESKCQIQRSSKKTFVASSEFDAQDPERFFFLYWLPKQTYVILC